MNREKRQTLAELQAEIQVSINTLRERLRTDGRLRTALRRSAGQSIAEAGVVEIFSLNPPPGHAEECFLTATLIAQQRSFVFTIEKEYSQRNALDDSFPSSFGASYRKLIRDRLQSAGQPVTDQDIRKHSLEKFFRRLLETDYLRWNGEYGSSEGDFPRLLLKVVRLAIGGGAPINWMQLLEDIIRWSRPGKYVQKQWAQEFYAPGYKKSGPSEDGQDSGGVPFAALDADNDVNRND